MKTVKEIILERRNETDLALDAKSFVITQYPKAVIAKVGEDFHIYATDTMPKIIGVSSSSEDHAWEDAARRLLW